MVLFPLLHRGAVPRRGSNFSRPAYFYMLEVISCKRENKPKQKRIQQYVDVNRSLFFQGHIQNEQSTLHPVSVPEKRAQRNPIKVFVRFRLCYYVDSFIGTSSFVAVIVVLVAAGAAGWGGLLRCDPMEVAPMIGRLCRNGACSVARASSSTVQSSLSSSSSSLLLLLWRRKWARIKVLCRSGMDRTSVCMFRQSMRPSGDCERTKCST